MGCPVLDSEYFASIITRGEDSETISQRLWIVKVWIKDNFGEFMRADVLNGMWLRETVVAPWNPSTKDYPFDGSQNWADDTHGGNLKGQEGAQGTQTLTLDHISRTHTIFFQDIDMLNGLKFLDVQNK